MAEQRLPYQPGQPIETSEEGLTRRPTREETKPPGQAPEDKPDAQGEEPHRCPRCGWDQNRPLDIEPTEDDKREFLRKVLFSIDESARFVKTYERYGGMVQITFRTQTVSEHMAADQAARRVLRDKGVVGVTVHNSTAYFMAMSLQELKLVEEDKVIEHRTYPEVTEQAYPRKGEDDYRPLAERATESLFRGMATSRYNLIYEAFMEFTGLVQSMEVRSKDPDFFNGIRTAS